MNALFKHILWATDYSEEAEEALRYAGLFAKTFGARLSALHVVPDFSPVLYESLPAAEAELTGKIEAATEAAESRIREISRTRGIEFSKVYIKKGPAAESVCEVANKEKADLIVIGRTGTSGPARSVIGSIAAKILRNSAVPVLVAKKAQTCSSVCRILVPTDFTIQEDVERDFAWKLARGFKASLLFLYITELYGHDFRLTDEHLGLVLGKLKARRRKEHVGVEILEDVYKAHNAAEGIIDYAKLHPFDLIVMSTQVGKVARFFLGSTTEKVIAHSPIAVFAIPPTRG
jgi:nucleotide-binding universal stress UspA family protein